MENPVPNPRFFTVSASPEDWIITLLEESTEDVQDDELPFDEEEKSKYPDDLIGATRELFKNCKSADLKAEVRETVKSYGKFTDVPEDVLKGLYDRLSA